MQTMNILLNWIIKIAYIDAVLGDLELRFEGLTESTRNFDTFYDLYYNLGNTCGIMDSITGLKSLYPFFDPQDLKSELHALQSLLSSLRFKFHNFAAPAKFSLTTLKEIEYPLMHFFFSVILILPGSTADCERSFSAMNLIKNDEGYTRWLNVNCH